MPQGLLPFSFEHPHKRYEQERPSCRRNCQKYLSMNPRKTKKLIAILLLLSVILYIVAAFLISENVVIDNSFGGEVSSDTLQQRHDFKEATIDKLCSSVTSRCYSVIDKRQDNGAVERHLIVDGFDDESDSIVRLIPPRDSDFSSSDTRVWPVDHSHLNAQYIAGMAVAPFLTSSLSLQKNESQKNILEIGLGGGTLDMFLLKQGFNLNVTVVELDPTINLIAEKWFDVKSNENRRTIVGDGIEYMRELQKKGDKLDVVFIDACDTSQILPCPAATFWNPEVIRTLRNILKDQGIAVINILQLSSEGNEQFDQVISGYTEVFPTCLRINMIIEANVILVCVPYEIGDIDEQLSFYSARLNAVISTLNLSEILKEVKVTSALD